MTTLTKSAFAAQQGWRPSYVSKLIQQGRIVLDGSLVDVEKSLQRIAETKGGRADVAERNAQERAGDKQNAKLDMPLDALHAGSRAHYKALAMQFENNLQKLNMALDKGMRFKNADIRSEAQGIGNTLRAAMERLVDTTAPRIAIAKTRDERLRILQKEILEMRKAVKNAFPRAMIRLARKA